MQWKKVTLSDGRQAAAPLIISASRATDLPAFYSEWFFNRLEEGWLEWVNPFNRKVSPVSFANCRVIVFWSKNFAPMLDKLPLLEQYNIHPLFQFTLNDYEAEEWEPGLPPLQERIATFRELSRRTSPAQVIWRFDPLILTERTGVEQLLEKLSRVAAQLQGTTEKLVFSFFHLKYRSGIRRLHQAGFRPREFSPADTEQLAAGIARLAEQRELSAATCAEQIDLEHRGITHNRCIDDELLLRLWPDDGDLTSFLGWSPPDPQQSLFGESEPVELKHNPKLKDKGQREACGCIVSKDIGSYNTCAHLCTYCYANHNHALVRRRVTEHDPLRPRL